jgi:hypothetical protein
VELSRLIALVDQWQGAPSYEPLQLLVHQEVLMFDAAGSGSDEGNPLRPSRRQLLITLLALPVALAPSLQLGGASSVLVRKLLAQCATSITAAWHLLKQTDFAIVEQHVSSYLLALTALARQPSAHQAEAARLASLAYRALGIVALHRRQFSTRDYYVRQALLYAEIVGDPHLQSLALMSIADFSLLYRNDPSRAAETLRRALLDEDKITPSERSRLSASLALELAMRGQEQESLRHVHAAEERYPAHPETEPSFLYAEFTPGNLVLYRGLTHLSLARQFPERHHQEEAWETFGHVGRLAAQGAVTERVRVEIVNHQAATAVEMRDLERFVSYLRLGVQGASDLGSAQRLHEAVTTWRRALQVWPAEPRVTALAELFADSPVQVSADQQ